MKLFHKKIWWVIQKAVLLHPLTRKRPLRQEEKSSLKELHRQRVVQEKRTLSMFVIYII